VVYRFYLATGTAYYFFDILVKFYEFEYADYFDHCRVAFLIHHMVTVAGFKSIYSVDRYEWF
jgi:hypothetical protein